MLLAKSAYFSVSFALLRWEVGGALSRAMASDEVKGREGRKVKATDLLKHSQYQIQLSNFLCL